MLIRNYVKNLWERMTTSTLPFAIQWEEPVPAKKTNIQELLGFVTPQEVHIPSEDGDMISAETMAYLEDVSQDLVAKFTLAQEEFLKQYPNMRYSEQTFVLTNAATALLATWGCSEKALENTTLDMGAALMVSVSCLQHNFSEKQKELFGRIGNHIH